MIEIQPYIEIVQIPKGEAPYWVRESLVGLRLPLIERHYDWFGYYASND